MTTALLLPPKLRAQILDEAHTAFPRECCGLIEGVRAGEGAEAIALHPARNRATTSDRFEIDPADHFSALRQARTNGHEIVGCYHSHPNGVPEPSPRDRDGAGEDGFVWVVAAVGVDSAPGLGAFAFRDGAFAPLTLLEQAIA